MQKIATTKLRNCLLVALGLICYSSLFAQTEKMPANSVTEYEAQYQDRIKQDKLFGVYIPRNLEDAFLQLDKLIEQPSKNKLLLMQEDSAARKLHFSLGRWMMVNWGFYGGSRYSHYLYTAGVTYPDDMADLTIIAYTRYLKKREIDLKGLCMRYKAYRAQLFEEEQKEKPKTVIPTGRKVLPGTEKPQKNE